MAFKIKNIPPNEWTTAIHSYYHDGRKRNCLLLADAVSRPVAENSCCLTRSSFQVLWTCWAWPGQPICIEGQTLRVSIFPAQLTRKILCFGLKPCFLTLVRSRLLQMEIQWEGRIQELIGMGKDLSGSIGRTPKQKVPVSKPINIFKQFITLLTLFIYRQAVVKRTGIFFAIFICGKEALFSGICTHIDSKAPWGCDQEWTPQTVWTNLAPR